MGCDIHCFVEMKASGEHWESWNGTHDIDMPRNYRMFTAMAGVRQAEGVTAVSEPRGLPSDCSEEIEQEFQEIGTHSESWLTPKEFKRAISAADGSIEYLALLAAMQSLGKHGCEVRLVFAFDS